MQNEHLTAFFTFFHRKHINQQAVCGEECAVHTPPQKRCGRGTKREKERMDCILPQCPLLGVFFPLVLFNKLWDVALAGQRSQRLKGASSLVMRPIEFHRDISCANTHGPP